MKKILSFFLILSLGLVPAAAAEKEEGAPEVVVARVMQMTGLAAAGTLPIETIADKDTGAQVLRYALGADGRVYGKGSAVPSPARSLEISVRRTGVRWEVKAELKEPGKSGGGEESPNSFKKNSARNLEDAARMVLSYLQERGAIFNPLNQGAERETGLSPANPWPDRNVKIFPGTSADIPLAAAVPDTAVETAQEEASQPQTVPEIAGEEYEEETEEVAVQAEGV